MYKLVYYPEFKKRINKLIQRDKSLESNLIETLNTLRLDPFTRKLRTHKVDALKYGKRWSSKVTRDVRIIWDFDREKYRIILLLTIGKHSGSKRVYK